MTDKELYEFVRENYNKVNKDYLNEQMQKACKDMKISCFKCHGKGTYKVIDPDYSWNEHVQLQCEICKGTGKITLEAYEWFQKEMRDKE